MELRLAWGVGGGKRAALLFIARLKPALAFSSRNPALRATQIPQPAAALRYTIVYRIDTL